VHHACVLSRWSLASTPPRRWSLAQGSPDPEPRTRYQSMNDYESPASLYYSAASGKKNAFKTICRPEERSQLRARSMTRAPKFSRNLNAAWCFFFFFFFLSFSFFFFSGKEVIKRGPILALPTQKRAPRWHNMGWLRPSLRVANMESL